MEEEFQTDDNSWPIPKFYFSVDLGFDGMEEVPFQEVSGLDIETQTIAYRAPRLSTPKMPASVKADNVTMKKGLFKDADAFWEWCGKMRQNNIERTTITIKLLDEAGHPLMSWVLANAWPTRIVTTETKTYATEVTVEAIEIVHEGITLNEKEN